MLNDMKAGLTSTRKPMLSLLPRVAKTYLARALGYGSAKYRRSSFYGDAPPGVTPALRLLAYLDAAERHISRVTDALNLAIGTGGDVVAAARTADEDGGGDFPPSMLPDLAHALASLAIGVLCAVKDGLLPEDPGQPWEQHPDYAAAMARRGGPEVYGTPQKLSPAGESVVAPGLVPGDVGPVTTPSAWWGIVPPTGLDYRRMDPAACAPAIGHGYTTILRTSVQPRIAGGLAADLCPGESDWAADPLPPLPARGKTGNDLRGDKIQDSGHCYAHGYVDCRECLA